MEAATQFSEGAMTACFAPRPATALVVDPSAEQRQLVRMTLALDGYAVVEATDADAALRALHDGPPGLLVTSVRLEGACDGLGLCGIARARASAAPCALVVLSESLDADRLRRIEECGARVVVQPPFSPAQLVSAVREAEAQADPSAATQSRRHASVLSLMTTLAIAE